jgi:hypothetical protein
VGSWVGALSQKPTLSATKVENARGTTAAKRPHYCADALLGQTDRFLDSLFFVRVTFGHFVCWQLFVSK